MLIIKDIFSYLSVVFTFIVTSHTLKAQAQKIEGVIIEKVSKLPIPYATIKLKNANLQIVSNTEGVFVLASSIQATDTLIISSVGFLPIKVFASTIVNGKTRIFELEENVTMLNDVVINPIKTEALLKEAVKNSNASYVAPALLTGYYKEFVKRDELLSKYADGVIAYLVERSKKGLPKVSLTVLQSRVKEIEIPEEDEKINDLNTPLDIRNIGAFSSPNNASVLDSLNFNVYKYKLNEVEENGRATYVVYFEPKVGSQQALYHGRIYIDKEKMLITGLDYTVAPISISFLKKINLLGINFASKGRTLSLRYKIDNNQYSVAYIGSTFKMTIKSKKLDQANTFKSEFWVTTVKTNVELPLTDQYNKKALYKRGSKFTTQFWDDYSFTNNTKEEIDFLSIQ